MRAVHAIRVVAFIVGPTLSMVVACGSRGPLDDTATVAVETVDAAVDVAAPDATVDASTVIVPVDAAPEAGIIACGTCLVDQCTPGILKCAQTPACAQIFQCVITTCAASGGLDTSCLIGCAAGDFAGAAQIFGVFQCVTQTCGGQCNGLLGALTGGGGGGAGDAGKRLNPALAGAFSAWPELTSHE